MLIEYQIAKLSQVDKYVHKKAARPLINIES